MCQHRQQGTGSQSCQDACHDATERGQHSLPEQGSCRQCPQTPEDCHRTRQKQGLCHAPREQLPKSQPERRDQHADQQSCERARQGREKPSPAVSRGRLHRFTTHHLTP